MEVIKILEIENLSFNVEGKKILKEISYTFEPGKLYTILGNNGAGKSTLAKLIMGLNGYYQNHSGEIYLNQEEISQLKVDERAKRGIAYTYQEPVRFKGILIRDYLKISSPERIMNETELGKVLNLVGLSTEYLSRKVDHSLSGGERKRVELASAMMMKPKIIFFDEPDSGIDMMSNKMLKDMFNEMKESGTTVVSITHREEISLIADHALLICDGKLVADDKPEIVNRIYKENCDACDHVNNPDKTWRNLNE
ncbi:MAG TPA: ATP-binding cassette domain-containing protein [Thermotogota bacterium]|nr:ATP-binding cassette domain-containing protein [Thermotogota bacterium]HPJ88848.1 ATP-binding cassette domain-containing protein [Thermotogota bacterium]HPR97217.1 ATP-binding cassette domain-containing protein [Thermotogota bacterium]